MYGQGPEHREAMVPKPDGFVSQRLAGTPPLTPPPEGGVVAD